MENEAFSSIDFVAQCLVDNERTVAFQKAIKRIIKKDDTVLDLGTGSGVMALLAAKAGAKKVIAVEIDSLVAQTPQNAICLNNLEDKMSLLIGDAQKCIFPENTKFNVVISEMLTTGMVDESQVRAINNLHDKRNVDGSTIFLPYRHDTFISLSSANFVFFGIKIPMILHLWKWHNWKKLRIKQMTDNLLLNSIYFNKRNDEKFEATLTFEVKKTGTINSLCLTSRTFLTNKIFLDDTEALNAPMLIPIAKKTVKKGQQIKLKINYIFGDGYNKFRANILD